LPWRISARKETELSILRTDPFLSPEHPTQRTKTQDRVNASTVSGSRGKNRFQNNRTIMFFSACSLP
jgi:hypothetical protein